MREVGQAIGRNSALLAGFAVLTALLVAGTFLGTRDDIAAARRAAEEKALLQIVPRAEHDNSMLDDRLPAAAGGYSDRSTHSFDCRNPVAGCAEPSIDPAGKSSARAPLPWTASQQSYRSLPA